MNKITPYIIKVWKYTVDSGRLEFYNDFDLIKINCKNGKVS
tara:strand:- start:284 stop:406 length:123 start_codon:yes stop_codon:yes gene_type:complete